MDRPWRGAASLAVCLSLLAPALTSASPDTLVKAPPRTLSTQFNYKAGIADIPAGVKTLDLWIPVPSDNPYQTIGAIKVEGPGVHQLTREEKFGNRMVHVRVENPKAPVNVTVQFDVKRKEAAVLSSGEGSLERGRTELAQHLEADSKVPLGGRFADIANDVAGTKATATDKARALYEHVVANMQYDYKKESPKLGEGDVAFVCDYKKGNCSDLHSYLISLARNLKVPAYLEYGFPITGIPADNPLKSEGTIGGYHCWTWFYDQSTGWAPLDASDGRRWLDSNRPDVKERLFGNLILERSAVAFSRGRDINLVPKQQGDALNYFIYPYAEADSKALKPTWEVKFKILEAPAVSMDGGKISVVAPPQPSAQAQPVSTPSGTRVGFYGFVRLDAIHDSLHMNNGQAPFWVQSPGNANVASDSNGQFSLSPRLTRLGWNLAAPPETLRDYKVTGKIEIDFQNLQGASAESRAAPRIRHAYLQTQKGSDTWLFGQTIDLISPLWPSPNDDSLQWNAGNLGDRRVQVRYTKESAESPLGWGLALGLTGAVDAKDLDANGVRDGEDSGLPHVQGRVAWKAGQGTAGFWAHHAWEKATKPVAGENDFTSYSYGLDYSRKIGSKLDLKLELWKGSNLSDFRGGIGQGVNAGTAREIQSQGGWVEVGYQRAPNHRMAVGYTEDNPDDGDVAAGGRLRNYSVFFHNRWRLAGNIEVGANYLYWLTKWQGLATGINHRINAFIQGSF
jgi:hypothetical protein